MTIVGVKLFLQEIFIRASSDNRKVIDLPSEVYQNNAVRRVIKCFKPNSLLVDCANVTLHAHNPFTTSR